jgi:hypothetical protein
MVDIMVGTVTPVQNNQSRKGRHRQTLERKKSKEERKGDRHRRRHQDGVWVTLSRRAQDRQITY